MGPVALGRKNWLHVGSVKAGPRVAAILSVVETCRRLGVLVKDQGLSRRCATRLGPSQAVRGSKPHSGTMVSRSALNPTWVRRTLTPQSWGTRH